MSTSRFAFFVSSSFFLVVFMKVLNSKLMLLGHHIATEDQSLIGAASQNRWTAAVAPERNVMRIVIPNAVFEFSRRKVL
ncbi:unnamed protein product [Brassica oleracea]